MIMMMKMNESRQRAQPTLSRAESGESVSLTCLLLTAAYTGLPQQLRIMCRTLRDASFNNLLKTEDIRTSDSRLQRPEMTSVSDAHHNE